LQLAFWGYAFRRILGLALTYVVLVYVFSAILDAQLMTQVEQTLRWDIGQVVQRLIWAGEVAPEQYEDVVNEMVAQIRLANGFDEPFLVRVNLRAVRVLRFDFGEAGGRYPPGTSMLSVVAEYAQPTLILFAGAFLLQFILGILLGVHNANHVGSALDRLSAVLATATMSTPAPVAAFFAILLFVYVLPLAPSTPWIFQLPPSWTDFGRWAAAFFSHLALPLLTVAFLAVWSTALMVRNIVLGTLHEDFIMAGRARGLPERKVLFGHSLRTSAPPIATMATVGLFASMWGSFLVEPVFQMRGIGTLFLDAIRSTDVATLFALLVTITGATQLALMILDLAYGRLDPRIRVGGKYAGGS
jgi:peptide/nickel transport system permease protein